MAVQGLTRSLWWLMLAATYFCENGSELLISTCVRPGQYINIVSYCDMRLDIVIHSGYRYIVIYNEGCLFLVLNLYFYFFIHLYSYISVCVSTSDCGVSYPDSWWLFRNPYNIVTILISRCIWFCPYCPAKLQQTHFITLVASTFWSAQHQVSQTFSDMPPPLQKPEEVCAPQFLSIITNNWGLNK